MPRVSRYGYDSFPPAPLPPAPSPVITLLYRFRHQRGALAAAPPLLLAGRSRLRPAAGDRDGGVAPHQPHPQGAVQHRAAVPDRPIGEHARGRADGHGERLPERAPPDRGHVLPRLRVPPPAALALARRRADRAAGGAVAALSRGAPAGGRGRRFRPGSDLRLGRGGLVRPARLAADLERPDRSADARPGLRRRRGAGRLRPAGRMRGRESGLYAAEHGGGEDRDGPGRRRGHGAHRIPALLAAGEALARNPEFARAGLSALSGVVARGVRGVAAGVANPHPWPLSRPLPPPSPGEGNRPPEDNPVGVFSLF